MNNIELLNEDLQRQRAEEAEMTKENFKDEALTEKDMESLDKIKTDRTVVVVESNGESSKETSPEEYTSSIDSRIEHFKNALGEETTLKMLNSGDIKKTTVDIKNEARAKIVSAMKDLAEDDSISEDDCLRINNEALSVLSNHFKMTKIDSDVLANELSKLPTRQIMAILPKEFVKLYAGTTEYDKHQDTRIKEKLIAAVAYLAVTGPEMDYLNDYIDHENHLMEVSRRLIQCQVNVTETLKNKETIADIIKRSKVELSDYDVWSKYIKDPAKLTNKFQQRAVIHDIFADSYMEILNEYSDAEAQTRIMSEATTSKAKAHAYRNVTNLELFKYLTNVYMDLLVVDKRRSIAKLEKDALDAVIRIKRCKQDVPFPGYSGKEYNDKQIFDNYMTFMVKTIDNYIEAVNTVQDKSDGSVNPPVTVFDSRIYAMVILIIMGRLVKNLTKNTAVSVSNAVMLDAYFQLFCEMGADIYIMTDVLTVIHQYDTLLVSLK